MLVSVLFTQEIRFVELHTPRSSGTVSYMSARIRRKEGDETTKTNKIKTG